jgi:MFS family permease
MVGAMIAGRASSAIPVLLVPVAISQFLISLDFSCMTMVIPLLAKATGAAPALLQWTVSGAALVWGGCLILGGRVADRFGNRRVFVIGLALYILGALGCAVAASVHAVIAGRVLSGLGGALFGPAILAALIAGSSEGAERNRALVVYSIAQAMGSALGVAFGGLLAAHFGWRMIFVFNLSIAASGILAAAALPRPAPRPKGSGRSFDVAGAALVTAGCSLLVLSFSGLGRAGPFDTMVIVPAAAATAVLAIFVAVEARATAPILPLSLFRVPGFAPALTVSMASNASMAGFFYILATFLHQLAGYGADRIGMIFFAKLIGVLLAGVTMASLLRRLSPWTAMAWGCLATAAIMLALTQITVAMALWGALTAVVLAPIGQMAVVIATTNEVTARVPAAHRGVASAILLASTQIGVALAMGLYASALQRSGAGAPDVPAGFATVAAVATIGIAMALLSAWWRRGGEGVAPALAAQP